MSVSTLVLFAALALLIFWAVGAYNRLVRLLDRQIPVRMEVAIQTAFHAEEAQPNGINTIAEIPGVGHAPMFLDEAQVAVVREFLLSK